MEVKNKKKIALQNSRNKHARSLIQYGKLVYFMFFY